MQTLKKLIVLQWEFEFYNDQQVNAIPPTTIEDAHWDIDYVWKKPGNHNCVY